MAAKSDTDTVLHVKLTKGEDGYVVAECLDIPGCMSQGKTETEAIRNIKSAISLCLSVMVEDSLKKPRKLAKVSDRQRLFRLKPPSLESIAVNG